jgi:D-psicose/D-tagatose/L-ribulose 3-epimerase
VNRRGFLALSLAPAAAAWRGGNRCADFHLRFGVTQFDRFDPIADLDRLERWGYDYCEPSVARVMALGDAEFEAARRKAAGGRIHVEAMNSFIPAEMKIVGPDVDRARVEAYVAAALERADRLGARVVVFGSGGARRVPDGFPRDDAWRQLKEFLRAAGDQIARRKRGMVIGIEALRKAESNIVNTSAEAYRLSVETNHPNVRVIVDFFHLTAEGESPTILRRIKDRLVHCHFSNPVQGRFFPREISECPGYGPFFENLRAIGYRGRMSLEAGSTDAESDLPAGLAVLRQLYGAACSGRAASVGPGIQRRGTA